LIREALLILRSLHQDDTKILKHSSFTVWLFLKSNIAAAPTAKILSQFTVQEAAASCKVA
jgi:uncharacterized protein (DUF608 family)